MRFDAGTIGVDEAGRGPLAGPVVAAAVVLDASNIPANIADSKLMNAAQRDAVYAELRASASIGVGIVGPRVIDRVNVLQATMLAMERAVWRLLSDAGGLGRPHLVGGLGGGAVGGATPFVTVRIDGNRVPSGLRGEPYLPVNYLNRTRLPKVRAEAVVGGDRKDVSIAAASIVAKVTRDNLLLLLDQRYPQYGFAQHKGYPTRQHRACLKEHGASAAHRQSFRLLG